MAPCIPQPYGDDYDERNANDEYGGHEYDATNDEQYDAPNDANDERHGYDAPDDADDDAANDVHDDVQHDL